MNIKILFGSLLTIIVFGLVGLLFSFRKIFDKRTDMKKRKGGIEYLVYHYPAAPNPNIKAEDIAYFLQDKCGAGAHWVIGDEIIQTAPEDMRVNAVGGRKWVNWVPKSWLKGKITNDNSLSFEICLKRGDYNYNNNLMRVAASNFAWQLVNKGLDPSRVVRHLDVRGKYCPFFACVYLTEQEWKVYQRNPDISGFYNEYYENQVWFRFHKYVTFLYWKKRAERGQIDSKRLAEEVEKLGVVHSTFYGYGGIPYVKRFSPLKK